MYEIRYLDSMFIIRNNTNVELRDLYKRINAREGKVRVASRKKTEFEFQKQKLPFPSMEYQFYYFECQSLASPVSCNPNSHIQKVRKRAVMVSDCNHEMGDLTEEKIENEKEERRRTSSMNELHSLTGSASAVCLLSQIGSTFPFLSMQRRIHLGHV